MRFPPSADALAVPFPRRDFVFLADCGGFGVVASPDVSSDVRGSRDDPAATVMSASPPRRHCCGVFPWLRRSVVVVTPDVSSVVLVAFVVAAAASVVAFVPRPRPLRRFPR